MTLVSRKTSESTYFVLAEFSLCWLTLTGRKSSGSNFTEGNDTQIIVYPSIPSILDAPTMPMAFVYNPLFMLAIVTSSDPLNSAAEGISEKFIWRTWNWSAAIAAVISNGCVSVRTYLPFIVALWETFFWPSVMTNVGRTILRLDRTIRP